MDLMNEVRSLFIIQQDSYAGIEPSWHRIMGGDCRPSPAPGLWCTGLQSGNT